MATSLIFASHNARQIVAEASYKSLLLLLLGFDDRDDLSFGDDVVEFHQQ